MFAAERASFLEKNCIFAKCSAASFCSRCLLIKERQLWATSHWHQANFWICAILHWNAESSSYHRDDHPAGVAPCIILYKYHSWAKMFNNGDAVVKSYRISIQHLISSGIRLKHVSVVRAPVLFRSIERRIFFTCFRCRVFGPKTSPRVFASEKSTVWHPYAHIVHIVYIWTDVVRDSDLFPSFRFHERKRERDWEREKLCWTRMDGWMDGQKEGWMDGWVDGWMASRYYESLDCGISTLAGKWADLRAEIAMFFSLSYLTAAICELRVGIRRIVCLASNTMTFPCPAMNKWTNRVCGALLRRDHQDVTFRHTRRDYVANYSRVCWLDRRSRVSPRSRVSSGAILGN